MNLTDQSYQDLSEDSSELDFLVSDIVAKANQFVLPELMILQTKIKNFNQAVRARHDITSLVEIKQELYLNLREMVSLTASLVTAPNWQSPVVGGQVRAGINDYSRDQSIPGVEYEKKFSREFVGRWRGIPIPVFLTNSGMGALTTAITYLIREKKVRSHVFVGRNSYFQNKDLISSLIPAKIEEFEEEDDDIFIKKNQKYKPSVIFIDSLSNTMHQTRPNLKKMIRFLAQVKQETYLVIDNTCLAIKYNPIKDLYPKRGKLKILVWESLNKYYQYGMDRTIGGFIWSLPQDAGGLYYARMHAGTIMSDISQAMLPSPNKMILDQRIDRIWRNTTWLAEALGNKCVYSRAGGSLVLKINRRNLNLIIRKAKKMNIPLAMGTSFGLNMSRIYLTATHSDFGEPFVRLSLGTETLVEINRLLTIL